MESLTSDSAVCACCLRGPFFAAAGYQRLQSSITVETSCAGNDGISCRGATNTPKNMCTRVWSQACGPNLKMKLVDAGIKN